jgi:hypothetical protein
VGKQYQRPERIVTLSVHNIGAKPAGVTLEGQPAKFGWDAKRQLLTVQVPATARAASTVAIALR